MNLVIDIGNSRIKWACEHNGILSSQAVLTHAELNSGALWVLWQTLPVINQIALACVSSPDLLEKTVSTARRIWPSVAIIFALSQSQAFGVTNAYLQPHKLGVDRWLALIAARKSRQAVCIVDCGTAITLDLLDGDGQHLGGLICPGLTLMKKTLCFNTEALAFDSEPFDLNIANNTQSAIDSGTLLASIGLIESTLSRQTRHFELILTGGDAKRIAGNLACEYTIDENLVLKGLALLINNN